MTEPTQVYAVIAGVDYGGEQFHTLKLFKNENDAYKYKEELKYDYVVIELREIIS